MYGFSDSLPIGKVSDWEQYLASQRVKLCLVRGPKGSLTFAEALAHVEAFLNHKVGRGALARFTSERPIRSAAGANKAALAAVVGGVPGLALAALLAAHRERPNDPLPLLNASVILTNVGLRLEGLAFLDAADRHIKPADRGPMGLRLEGVSLNNRGYALISLGRFPTAAAALQHAVLAEPLLSEARRNLAVALFCLGHRTQGAKWYQRGIRRQDLPDQPGSAYPDPNTLFDLSQGVEPTLPEISYPGTAEQGAARANDFDAAFKRHEKLAFGLLNQAHAIPRNSGNSALLRRRRIAILDIAIDPTATPALKQLWDSLDTQLKQNTQFVDSFDEKISAQVSTCGGRENTPCFTNWCVPAMKLAHAEWLSSIMQYDATTRDWARGYYKLATGLAANVADPGSNQYAVLVAQSWIEERLTHLVGAAHIWMFLEQLHKKSCISPPPASSGGEGALENLSGVPPCPPELKNLKLSLKLPLPPIPDVPLNNSLTVGVTCDSVSLEFFGQVGKDHIEKTGPFASITYKPSQGKGTVFVGVKSSIPGVSAKGGVYVNLDDSNGHVEVDDVGVKVNVGPNVQLPGSPVSVSDSGDWVHVGTQL